MIFDKLKNYKLYSNLSAQIAKALTLAAQTDFEKIADGKYPLDSENLYYTVQRYKTSPLLDKIEAHRKYIDIQLPNESAIPIVKGLNRQSSIATKKISNFSLPLKT
ncbi:MAG: YhcH/YjgK/YiaL family protein [Phycisphaerae bacterium]|nr:YhcH/YjgK/YiaL family protein [Phycisphaerae bacterium]